VSEKSERLISLDVFRGITIAGMVLVNNPGTWSAMYGPLDHAEWDGWTPTDFIFPFFLFIVGVAMTFSFDKRLASGFSKVRLFEQVVRRTIILFFLGLILTGFPNFRLIAPYLLTLVGLEFLFRDEPIVSLGTTSQSKLNKAIGWSLVVVAVLWFFIDIGHFNGKVKGSEWKYLFPLTNDAGGGVIRVPGVLQRIALCYFLASVIMMFTGLRGRIAWVVGILAGYWLVMKYIHAPADWVIGGNPDAPAGAPFPGGLNDWIDVKLLGAHLYNGRPDPEGLLSTLPATATTLMGILTGTFLHTDQSRDRKAAGMYTAGAVLLFVGIIMHQYFPINKKIWSSTFVVFMAGWALAFLAFCFYLIDVLGYKKWATPFLVFGTNAILAFFGSSMLSRLMGMVRWNEMIDGVEKTWNVKSFIYEKGFCSWLSNPKDSSLGFALFYIVLWLALMYPLYRKKIFLKV
jgi:predicted acyltransferase